MAYIVVALVPRSVPTIIVIRTSARGAIRFRRALAKAYPSAAIVAVTGHQPDLIRQAINNPHITFVQNDSYESGGMLSSVKAGLAAVEGRCAAFFLMLLDQPLVRADTLNKMSNAWERRRSPL